MIFFIYKFAWKLISPTGISTLIDQVMKRHSYWRVVRDFAGVAIRKQIRVLPAPSTD